MVPKKENLTVAISAIKNEEILTMTHTGLAQRLQGKIPSLQIWQNTEASGDYDVMVNMRGFSAPLFIVDGMTRVSGAEFQRINPDDIENISILCLYKCNCSFKQISENGNRFVRLV